MFRKISALLLALCMIISLTACGKKGESKTDDSEPEGSYIRSKEEDEAASAALKRIGDTNNPVNADGSCTIHEGACFVDVTMPEGWKLSTFDYDHAEFTHSERNCVVTFTMYCIWDEEEDGGRFKRMAESEESRYLSEKLSLQRESCDYTDTNLPFHVEKFIISRDYGDELAAAAWYMITEDDGRYYLRCDIEDGFVSGIDGESLQGADCSDAAIKVILNCANTSWLQEYVDILAAAEPA